LSIPQNGLYYTFDMQKVISVKTDKKRLLVDITSDVEGAVSQSKIDEGIALIFVKHTTCALMISEMEDALEKDILKYFEKEGPKGPFAHTHGGQSHTPSHILSASIGQSVSIPLKNGKMLLGTWQRICLAEFDGPREREIIIQTIE